MINKYVRSCIQNTKKNMPDYFKKCQEILTMDCPAVFICDPGRNIITQKNVAGYTPYPVNFYDFSTLYFVD